MTRSPVLLPRKGTGFLLYFLKKRHGLKGASNLGTGTLLPGVEPHIRQAMALGEVASGLIGIPRKIRAYPIAYALDLLFGMIAVPYVLVTQSRTSAL